VGEWGIVGKTIFNAKRVNEQIAQVRDKKPLKRGYFVYDYTNEKIKDLSIKWIDDDEGYISIYENVKKYFPYVIGGDTAGEGSDYFGGQVLDNITGEQVAVLHHQFDEDLYAKQMYCLGKYYNYALLSIEVNFSTYPVKELQRLGYTNQYKREVIDEISNIKQHKYGFRTTSVSRPVVIADLVQIVRESVELINDVKTLEEMLTFVRNEKGKAVAQEGKHDDLIISLAIAHKAREQQSMKVRIPSKPKQRNVDTITGY
jgi:phage terminase large subunit